ncbi:MAG: nucleotide exchange factor GrpE [Elusimicrobiota bacterium]
MSNKKKNDNLEYETEDNQEDALKKIKKVKSKLKACQKEKAEYLAGWQRAKADLINYKREQENKISEYYKFANEGLIIEILPVLDSFEQALKHISRQEKENIQQVYNQLKKILKSNGVEEIPTIGKKFNPELHEAIEEIASNKKPGIIVEEIQRGYKLHGKIIRASRVKISK